jgi:7-carboxy-7-deazaguanine synthase
MKINEIYYSIQGEGQWIGYPNIFIRTTGCNLRCTYCDTKYSYENGKKMSKNDVLNEIQKYPCKKVCITGGEPLIQKETYELVDILLKEDYMICLETNGSQSIKELAGQKSLIISMDIKCPSSEMIEKMNFENLSYLTTNDQLKFIINNKKDYNYAKSILKKYKPITTVFFQPTWGFNPKELATWIIKDSLNVRLGLQLHKIIFGNTQGV